MAEPVIDPELPIIDPHHHFFLTPSPASIVGHESHSPVGRYYAEELAEDLNSGHNVVATVFVQCYEMYRTDGPPHLKYVGETEFVQGAAAIANSGILGPCKFCSGIVATADHEADAATMRETIAAHRAAGRNFRGIRFLGGQSYRIPFAEPRFREAFAVLVEEGIPFDVNGPESSFPLDFGKTLGDIADLAEAFPNATIIVNHCGGLIGPKAFGGDGGAAALQAWKDGIVRLGKLPNVYMKLGGITMTRNGFDLEKRATPVGSSELAELLLPYMGHILDCFGAYRCMFESNFPMDKPCVSYATLWNTFKRIADKKGLSDVEKKAVFAGTAAKVYRLALPS